MINKINSLIVGEEGQGMTEYGLVLGAIAIGAIAVLVALRDQIRTLITNITTGLGTSNSSVTTPTP